MASQKQPEGTRITGDPSPQVPAPPFTMVAEGRQSIYRPTITPNKTCSANIYRRINRRVGALTSMSTLQEQPGPLREASCI